MSDARTITAYSADTIYIDGLTKGPRNGWSWNGQSLTHPLGIGLVLSTDAADRVAAAVKTAKPATSSRLTGLEVSQLPEPERTGYEWDRALDGEPVGWYVKSTKAAPATVEITVAEIVQITKGR